MGFQIKCKDNHEHQVFTKSYAEAHRCKHCAIWVPIDMWRCTCCGLACREKGSHTKFNYKTHSFNTSR